jgi:serine/threonine protein kinase
MTASTSSTPAELARAIKQRWRKGEVPDAADALAGNSELRAFKAETLDLIYEEFWLRRANGERVDPEEFCAEYGARFPHWAKSIRVLVFSDAMLGCSPSVCDDIETLEESPEVCWPPTGTQLGRFKLIRVLGKGLFSCVYLATEESAGNRPVAVKISVEGGTDEAHTLGRLNHDHVVPILWADIDPATKMHVVCMPFLGSTTLEDVLFAAYPRLQGPPPVRATVITDAIRRTIRADDPPPDRLLAGPDLSRLSFVDGILRLAESLAKTLAFLHQQKLAHSDLKPSNILLTPSGQPLLLDFNLSISTRNSGVLVGGTPRYMPPEQLAACLEQRPLPVEAACRAELYSLAVILYELLTGRHPLEEVQPVGLKKNKLVRWFLDRLGQGRFRPLRELNPAVPRRIAELIDRCLSLNPEDRPVGMTVLAAELHHRRRRLLQPVLLATGSVLLLVGSALAIFSAAKPPIPAAVHRAAGRDDLEQGWQLARAGKNDEAAELLLKADQRLTSAIDAHVRLAGVNHGPWQDYLARGRAKMLLGQLGEEYRTNFTEAQLLFLEADRLVERLPPDQRPSMTQRAALWACLSYCYSRQGACSPAGFYGEKALEAGPRSAALLNNVGHAYMMRANVDRARRHLTEARRRDPNLLPALLNETHLALQCCLLALQAKPQVARQVKLPRWVFHQLNETIPRQVKNGNAKPAYLYAVAASVSVRIHEKESARRYLEQALRLGADIRHLANDPKIQQDRLLFDWLGSPEAKRLSCPLETSSLNFCLLDSLTAALP